jgi:hypothetical protein
MKRKADSVNDETKKQKIIETVELEIVKLSTKLDEEENKREIEDTIDVLIEVKNREPKTKRMETIPNNLPGDVVSNILSFCDFMLHRHYNSLSRDRDHSYALKLFFGFSVHDPSRTIRMLFPSITFATQGTDMFSYDLFLYDDKTYNQSNEYVSQVLSQALPAHHIISLSISGLRGAVVNDIMDYVNLTSLDMANTVSKEAEVTKLLGRIPNIRHLVVPSPEDSSSPSEFLKIFDDVEMNNLRSLQLEFNSYEEWDSSDSDQLVDLILHYTTIERLSLVDAFTNDTSAIEEFAALSNLKVLDLHASSHAPVIKSSALLKSTNIRDLSLYGFEVNNVENVLSEDRIAVISVQIADPSTLEALNRRSDPTSLRHLDLFSSEFGNNDLSPYFTNVRDLKSLELRYSNLSWLPKTNLAQSLVSLIIPECDCSDDVLIYLNGATKLKVLSLEQSWNMTMKGIKAISRHPTLTQLELGGTLGNIVDDALRHLLTSTVLQQLDVSSNASSDPDVLSLVAANDSLTMLDCRDMDLSDKSLEALFHTNQSLTSLFLSGKMNLSYEKHFKDMSTNLTDLYLENVVVKDLHLALAHCTHLQMVWLQYEE